jgi:hypothetical protein
VPAAEPGCSSRPESFAFRPLSSNSVARPSAARLEELEKSFYRAVYLESALRRQSSVSGDRHVGAFEPGLQLRGKLAGHVASSLSQGGRQDRLSLRSPLAAGECSTPPSEVAEQRLRTSCWSPPSAKEVTPAVEIPPSVGAKIEASRQVEVAGPSCTAALLAFGRCRSGAPQPCGRGGRREGEQRGFKSSVQPSASSGRLPPFQAMAVCERSRFEELWRPAARRR